MPALSHAHNLTSQLAAQRTDDSGADQTQREIIYAYLCDHPGDTSQEISAATGIESHDVSSRLTELRDEGRVWNGDKRKCREKNQTMLTWFPDISYNKSHNIPDDKNANEASHCNDAAILKCNNISTNKTYSVLANQETGQMPLIGRVG